jgi:hypothetical protein
LTSSMNRAVCSSSSSETNRPGGFRRVLSDFSCFLALFPEFSTGMWISSVLATPLSLRRLRFPFSTGVDKQRRSGGLSSLDAAGVHGLRRGSEFVRSLLEFLHSRARARQSPMSSA